MGTAGPQLRAPDGHCRTSTASSRSQWALPDLNCELQISAGTVGLQLRARDLNEHWRLRYGSAHVGEYCRIDARLNARIERQRECQKVMMQSFLLFLQKLKIFILGKNRKIGIKNREKIGHKNRLDTGLQSTSQYIWFPMFFLFAFLDPIFVLFLNPIFSYF